MLADTVERDIVEKMVRAFYAKVLKDEHLGPYFTRTLGEDFNGGKWPGHLTTLKDFWMLIMTGKSGYNGHPFPPHAMIGQLYNESFDKWLALFHETVNEFFVPEIADEFDKKAKIVANQFIDYLELDEDDEDD